MLQLSFLKKLVLGPKFAAFCQPLSSEILFGVGGL